MPQERMGALLSSHKGVKMSTFRRTASTVAGSLAVVLLATGCASSGSGAGEAGDIELSISTFGSVPNEDLYRAYEKANPGIKIVANNIDTGGNARTDTFTKLAAGSGLSDVVSIEEGWLGSIMEVSDRFLDLRDYGVEDRKSDWLDWKYEQGVDADGRVIGYGTDIGPVGLCYNRTLFEAAGLPGEREAVAELFGGDDATWEQYFDLGTQYKEATGKAWYDHSGFLWNTMVNQLDSGYYTADGELDVVGNADLQERLGWIADGAEAGLSAGLSAWDWNGGKAFADGDFATFVCPGWMLSVVQGTTEAGGGNADTGWDFANVFPGGASNWGGSFLSVPAESEHPEEAAAFASWMTEPAQQISAFETFGTFPSTVEAQEELAASPVPNAFFNDAPIGQILADRAQGVVAQFKGKDDSVIQEGVFGPALAAIDRGDTDADQAWAQALELLSQLVTK